MKFTQKKTSKNKGFTLIELLVVITIIATLAVVVFVALNPGQRLKDARDARRTSDVDTILSAIHSSIVDNDSTVPAGLSTVERQLGTAGSGCAVSTGGCTVTATACLDMTASLAAYLKSIPTDPNGGTTAETNYSAVMDSNGIVTIRACGTEGSTNIMSSR